jgi:hypothetical protein
MHRRGVDRSLLIEHDRRNSQRRFLDDAAHEHRLPEPDPARTATRRGSKSTASVTGAPGRTALIALADRDEAFG